MIVKTRNYGWKRKITGAGPEEYFKRAMVGGFDCPGQFVWDFSGFPASGGLLPRVLGAGLFVLFWWIQFYGVTQLDQSKMLFERLSYEITVSKS